MGQYLENHKILIGENSFHILDVSRDWSTVYTFESYKEEMSEVRSWVETNCQSTVYFGSGRTILKFEDPEDLLLFKLGFYDSRPPVKMSHRIGAMNKVILPVIRRVMPSVLSDNLLGISPLVPPKR